MVKCARHKFDYLLNRDAIELSFTLDDSQKRVSE